MSRQRQTPIWPFMFVLFCLFVLSVAAPRDWQRIARKSAIDESLAQHAAQRRVIGVAPSRRTPADAAPQPVPAAPAGVEMIAADGPQLAEVVQPVFVEPHEKIAALPVEGSSLKISSARSTTTIDPTPTDAAAAPTAPSMPTISPPLAATPGTPSSAPPASATPPDTTSPAPQLATRPTRRLETPDLDTPHISDEQAPADATISDSPSTGGTRRESNNHWAPPVDLLKRLESLGRASECSQWALRAADLVIELTAPTPPSAQRTKEIVGELHALAGSAEALLVTVQQRDVAIELLRVRHALSRRLDVWELLPALEKQRDSVAHEAPRDPTRLAMCLADVGALVRHGGDLGDRWRNYLLLDTLESVAQAGRRGSDDETRAIAQRVLIRLSRGGLTTWQREFVNSGPMAQLDDELRNWAAEPVDARQLLVDLEHFEQTGLPGDARRLAEHRQRLSWLKSTEAEALAQRVETHYRNANLRVAIAEGFLDRLIPKSRTAEMAVNDRVLGLPTRGSSTMSTTVDVRLVPDPNRLRLALEANGQIFSTTRTTSGPATLYSQSDSHYFARKLMEVDVGGIRTWPAEADSDSSTRLRGVRTDFDGIPLLGALVENVARSRHADKADAARREVRRKVAERAGEQIDAEADARVEEANQQLRERVLAPLAKLNLQPSVIEMETSPQRLTMRLRVAAEEQLAGNTPRPQAPGDSLVSLQLHQSLLNNLCEQLQLEGRTCTVPELREHLAGAFNLSTVTISDGPGEDVRFKFAGENAIQIRCDDGRVQLTLALAELTAESKSWRNFAVRVVFRPEVNGLSARMVREGTIQLVGPRLNTKGQVVVRGIFNRAFPRDRTFDLIDPKWSGDARLAGLRISQFVVQDGWIGVAVGPEAPNAGPIVARRP